MACLFGDLGPCEVEWGGTSTGENTEIHFKVSDDTAPVKDARYGTTPKDEIYTGRSCMVECTLTETTLDQMGLTLSGNAITGTTTKEMRVSNPVGTSLRSIAALLIIKPIIGGVATTDESLWLRVFVAAPKVDWDLVFDTATQRLFKTTFVGYPVNEDDEGEAGTSPGDLFAIGVAGA